MPLSQTGRLKLGIIGCGWATANLHLPTLTRMADYDVVAVADTDQGRVEAIARRFHVPRRYRDAVTLIEDPDIEAVAVCVPPQDHASLAIEAMASGKHVFIEKPLALSLDHADRLVDASRRTKITVLVGFNLRWHRLIRQAKQLLNRRRLGRIALLRSVFTTALCHDEGIAAWRRDRALGGGVIQDLAVHHFDLWRFLLSSEVSEIAVSARSERWQDDAAVITARMINGTLVSAVCASGTADRHEVECYGEAGRLRVCCYRYDGLELACGNQRNRSGRIRGVLAKAAALPRALAGLRYGGEIMNSYEGQWRHFLQCIRTGEPPACTVEDGRRAVELAQAAAESAVTGHPVHLKSEVIGAGS